jgi:hypothetical protein
MPLVMGFRKKGTGADLMSRVGLVVECFVVWGTELTAGDQGYDQDRE